MFIFPYCLVAKKISIRKTNFFLIGPRNGPKSGMAQRGLQGSMGRVWGLKKNLFIKWAEFGSRVRAYGSGLGIKKKTRPKPDPLPFLIVIRM